MQAKQEIEYYKLMAALPSYISDLNLWGAIASTIGALFALYQACRSRKFAGKVERIRNEFIERRKAGEIEHVYHKLKSTIDSVRRFGPSSNSRTSSGLAGHVVAKDVEDFSILLREHTAYFNDDLFRNKANELCELLCPLIEKLTESKSFQEKRDVGMKMFNLLETFKPDVKSLYDDRRERKIY